MDTTLIQRPNHITSLASSGMLVAVEVSVYTATVQDKQISNEVTTAKKATADSGKFTKYLLAGNATHKALLNYRQTVANWMKRDSFQWMGKWYIVPAINLPKFSQTFASHKVVFDALKEKFKAEYTSMKSDMAFKQGDMFDPNAYPDIATLDGKFSMRMMVMDVPKGDFRVAVADDLADDLHEHYQQQVKQIIDKTMAKAASRLVTIAERIRYSCTEPEAVIDEDGEEKPGRRRKVYDTTLEQAIDICETIRGFNITGDPELEEARRALQAAIDGVTADDLRESATLRKAVKEDISDILSRFKPLVTTDCDEGDDE